MISELAEIQTHLQADETELKELTSGVLAKLHSMSDEDFEGVKAELVADFE